MLLVAPPKASSPSFLRSGFVSCGTETFCKVSSDRIARQKSGFFPTRRVGTVFHKKMLEENPILRGAQPVLHARFNPTKGETHGQNWTLQVRIPAHDSHSLPWNPSHYRTKRICAERRADVAGDWCCPDPAAARYGSGARHRNG